MLVEEQLSNPHDRCVVRKDDDIIAMMQSSCVDEDDLIFASDGPNTYRFNKDEVKFIASWLGVNAPPLDRCNLIVVEFLTGDYLEFNGVELRDINTDGWMYIQSDCGMVLQINKQAIDNVSINLFESGEVNGKE